MTQSHWKMILQILDSHCVGHDGGCLESKIYKCHHRDNCSRGCLTASPTLESNVNRISRPDLSSLNPWTNDRSKFFNLVNGPYIRCNYKTRHAMCDFHQFRQLKHRSCTVVDDSFINWTKRETTEPYVCMCGSCPLLFTPL